MRFPSRTLSYKNCPNRHEAAGCEQAAHVQHAVCFIEDQVAHALEGDLPGPSKAALGYTHTDVAGHVSTGGSSQY